MRSLVTTGLLLLAGFGALVGSKDTSSTILSTTTAVISRDSSHSMSSLYVANGDNVVQNLQQIGSMPASESPRHRQEKALLMKRIDRKTGKWGTTHPRYRLLEALYGFTRYQERNMAELNRWRTMYTNVNKQQKKVSLANPLPESQIDSAVGFEQSRQLQAKAGWHRGIDLHQ